jgi:copper chaperone CopZ
MNMKTLTLAAPSMYADHQVIEARRILLELPGVAQVYASSAFHAIEVNFDDKKTNDEAIREALEPSGYLNELPVPAEPGIAMTEASGERFMRHTANYPQTQQAISFSQEVGLASSAEWACPGFGPLTIDGEE